MENNNLSRNNITTNPFYRGMWIQASPHFGCEIGILDKILLQMTDFCEKNAVVFFLRLKLTYPPAYDRLFTMPDLTIRDFGFPDVYVIPPGDLP